MKHLKVSKTEKYFTSFVFSCKRRMKCCFYDFADSPAHSQQPISCNDGSCVCQYRQRSKCIAMSAVFICVRPRNKECARVDLKEAQISTFLVI